MNEPDPNLTLWLTLQLLCEQATRDWLTGLYNRRYFEETLADHIETAKRYDRKLSLVIFDLDDFKAINDAGGHEEGDSALRRFSELLRATARSADIICRIGGDEFAVLLPETGSSNAWKFVERVQTQQKSPTVTAGVAALPCDNLFKEADADLMARKHERQG